MSHALYSMKPGACHQLEQLCLDWSRDQGYDYAYGSDIAPGGDAPERSDYRQVVLQGRLLTV